MLDFESHIEAACYIQITDYFFTTQVLVNYLIGSQPPAPPHHQHDHTTTHPDYHKKIAPDIGSAVQIILFIIPFILFTTLIMCKWIIVINWRRGVFSLVLDGKEKLADLSASMPQSNI